MGMWHPDAIERQLAHLDANATRRIYTRGEYWDVRVRMMQHWSDYLNELRDGAQILRPAFGKPANRSEEHTSELQSLMRISYAVLCLKKTKKHNEKTTHS